MPPSQAGVATLMRCSLTSLFLCALVVVFMNTEMPGRAKAKEELLARQLETSQKRAEAKLAASEIHLARIEKKSRAMLRDAERASTAEMASTADGETSLFTERERSPGTRHAADFVDGLFSSAQARNKKKNSKTERMRAKRKHDIAKQAKAPEAEKTEMKGLGGLLASVKNKAFRTKAENKKADIVLKKAMKQLKTKTGSSKHKNRSSTKRKAAMKKLKKKATTKAKLEKPLVVKAKMNSVKKKSKRQVTTGKKGEKGENTKVSSKKQTVKAKKARTKHDVSARQVNTKEMHKAVEKTKSEKRNWLGRSVDPAAVNPVAAATNALKAAMSDKKLLEQETKAAALAVQHELNQAKAAAKELSKDAPQKDMAQERASQGRHMKRIHKALHSTQSQLRHAAASIRKARHDIQKQVQVAAKAVVVARKLEKSKHNKASYTSAAIHVEKVLREVKRVAKVVAAVSVEPSETASKAIRMKKLVKHESKQIRSAQRAGSGKVNHMTKSKAMKIVKAATKAAAKAKKEFSSFMKKVIEYDAHARLAKDPTSKAAALKKAAKAKQHAKKAKLTLLRETRHLGAARRFLASLRVKGTKVKAKKATKNKTTDRKKAEYSSSDALVLRKRATLAQQHAAEVAKKAEGAAVALSRVLGKLGKHSG